MRDDNVDLEPIRQAYIEGGNIMRAANLLNQRGIPSPKGMEWRTQSLSRVIEEHWPELLPPKNARGRRIRTEHILSQLVRCHCGHTMTPHRTNKQLYCSRAISIGRAAHGRYNVMEKPIIDWAKEEARHARIPTAVRFAATGDDLRAQLLAKRQRVIEAFMDNDISRDEKTERLAKIAAELDSLTTAERIVDVPAIDWEHWAPADLNAALRALWVYIQLDADLRPTHAVWRIEGWRAEGTRRRRPKE